MKVTVDKSSGFCWGVVRMWILLKRNLRPVRSFIHWAISFTIPWRLNDYDLKGLKQLRTRFNKTPGAKILIRAHGEPPETYKRAQELGITFIDATCPVVGKCRNGFEGSMMTDFRLSFSAR